MNFHRIRLGDWEHEHPHGRKEKGCDGEEETTLSHVPLAEFCGSAGEKQNGGEQHSVAQILRRNITGPFCLSVVSPGVSVGKARVLDETGLIKIWDKGMRIRGWVLERFFRHPCVIGFAQFRWETVRVKMS